MRTAYNAKTERNEQLLKLAGKMTIRDIAKQFDISAQRDQQIIEHSGIEVVRTFKHRPKRKPIPWTCKACGKYHPEGYARAYCDDKCRPVPDTIKPIKLKCDGCNKKYEITVREYKHNKITGSKRNFCSLDCYYKNKGKK